MSILIALEKLGVHFPGSVLADLKQKIVDPENQIEATIPGASAWKVSNPKNLRLILDGRARHCNDANLTAALRFQVSLLDTSIQQGTGDALWQAYWVEGHRHTSAIINTTSGGVASTETQIPTNQNQQ